MSAYDALPPEARRWLAAAALPWSAQSVARLWRRALLETKGDMDAAARRLSAAEQRLLARDATKVWGADHPSVRVEHASAPV
jgi:hypothetical protein